MRYFFVLFYGLLVFGLYASLDVYGDIFPAYVRVIIGVLTGICAGCFGYFASMVFSGTNNNNK